MEHRSAQDSPSPAQAAGIARPCPRGIFILHLLPVIWLFGGAIFAGRLLYFRDLSSAYAPDYAFLSRALAQGLWPLWNPYVDGGSPCLFTYPIDLLLVGLLGPRSPLGLGVALHVYLAMCGASVLACRLGRGAPGALVAGLVYGLSGFLLSSVNLLQLLYAATWAPWVLWALLALLEKPSGRRAAGLAALVALQASTLGGDIAVQTLLVVPFLAPVWRPPGARAWARLGQASLAALLLSAPTLAGLVWLLKGTARGQGFSAGQALGYSVHPVGLFDLILPRFFGDVHSFSEVGYWGQPFFPEGYPYLLSLYLGPLVLLLVVAARPSRLHLLLILGVLASLGSHGPLGPVLSTVFPFLRGPVKYLFVVTLAAALLASEGVERLSSNRLRRSFGVALLAGGVALCGLALVVHWRPDFMATAFAPFIPELLGARARFVTSQLWPGDWLASGGLCLAAALWALGSARGPGVLGLLLAIDLLTVNGALNPLAPASFYSLRPQVEEAVRAAEQEGRFRWFSYGVANSPGLQWNPKVARGASDVWLYYMDRQTLLPRSQAFEAVEGIFDSDRAGWAPPGSTLSAAELLPLAFAGIASRLRLANVRWVVSFDRLPDELVRVRREVEFPELLVPLRVYELRDPLPRAFVARDWPARASEVGPSPWSRVEYRRLDPHEVEVTVDGPPGTVVVLDPAHPSWRLSSPEGEQSIGLAFGRYISFPTQGGKRMYTLRLDPGWPLPSFVLAGMGVLVSLWLARRPLALDTVEPAR